MRTFAIVGHATDDSGLTLEGTLTVKGNEPPRTLTITPDKPEPPGGYNPGEVITYKISAQDDGQLVFAAEAVVNGVTVSLPKKAGSEDEFLFTVPPA